MVKNPIESLKANLHLLEHQIKRIEEEIQLRKELSERIIKNLKERLEQYKEAKTHRNSAINHTGERDFLKARSEIQKRIRETQHLIAMEERTCWNDIQKLQWEKRKLEKEKMWLEYNLRLLESR